MLTRQVSLSALIFIFFYLIQESVVTQFHLPAGGFSIFLIFTLVWAVLSTPVIGALSGFAAGFLMDLSQSSSGPFGQWVLIMILACYAISLLNYGNEKLRGNFIEIVFFIVVGVLAAEVGFLITGALLGVATGSIDQIILTLIGISIWTLVITPLSMPVFARLHGFVFNTRMHI